MSRTGKLEAARARIAASAVRCREAAAEARGRGNEPAYMSLAAKAQAFETSVSIIDAVNQG